MIAFLFAVLLAGSSPTPAAASDQCWSLYPSSRSVTTLTDAQSTWYEETSVPEDTLRARLSRVLRARKCYLNRPDSQVSPPHLDRVLETYDAEGELRAALREFDAAFAAYQGGLSRLNSYASSSYAKYEDAAETWRPLFHQQRGYLQYLLGNITASINHYLQAYRTAPTPAEQIEHLLNVGILQQRTQDYRLARFYFRRAQKQIQSHSLAPDDRTDLQSFADLVEADLLLEQTLNTDFDRDSLRHVRDMARRGRRVAEPGTERHARTTSLLSEALGYLGNFDAAYQFNKEVREYARAEDAARLQTLGLLKLGVLHAQTERWALADSTLQAALTRAIDLGDLGYQRRILRDLGRLHEMQTQWGQAEHFYRRGIAVIERYRESLTATQWSSTAFAQWRDVHRGLVRTLLAQNRPHAALEALDRSRARHLQDLRTQDRVATDLPTAARTRLDSVSRALSDVRTALGTSAGSTEVDLRARETALLTARNQLLKLDSTVATRPTITEVSETLSQQNRALVSYFLDDPWPIYDRPPRSAAFVLTADTLRVVPLSNLTQDSVRAQVQSISPLFETQRKPQRINAMHFDLRPLHTLHEQLYAPIADHLPPGRPLTVIPNGPLFHVPFSMLVSALPGGRYDHAQARYVLHERPTTLELATSMAPAAHDSSARPPASAPDIAAFGVSAFDTLRTVPSALQSTLPEAASDSSLVLPPLPGVRSEIDALRELSGTIETFVNEAATEPALASARRRASVLHLASHAFVHPSSPLQNAFLLHPDSTSDGILFLHELQHVRDRPLPLAVLSGCSTARGTLHGGEGMAGLQYAFRATGAQATVSTLWPAADGPSVALMKSFYQHLQSGLSKDRALRQAKLAYLEDHPAKASPFFWAPSVLYGSPTALPLDSPGGLRSWLSWPLGLALFLLLGGLVAWFRMRDRLPLPWHAPA